ncbi:hypothetical protein EGW08_011888 [Elysia chlorotica]|uniref:Uncharacterized protein n=1 Tax=Elysia chlorotica TaxID=188477 RepID=A0A3S1C1H1_ELYCH|nr:hypothetical protein EGW08_011888 [Elysia chlorotica]
MKGEDMRYAGIQACFENRLELQMFIKGRQPTKEAAGSDTSFFESLWAPVSQVLHYQSRDVKRNALRREGNFGKPLWAGSRLLVAGEDTTPRGEPRPVVYGNAARIYMYMYYDLLRTGSSGSAGTVSNGQGGDTMTPVSAGHVDIKDAPSSTHMAFTGLAVLLWLTSRRRAAPAFPAEGAELPGLSMVALRLRCPELGLMTGEDGGLGNWCGQSFLSGDGRGEASGVEWAEESWWEKESKSSKRAKKQNEKSRDPDVG